MLRIVFKDGSEIYFGKKDFTDYMYDRKCFIVIKDGQYIAIYNLDCVATIHYLKNLSIKKIKKVDKKLRKKRNK